MKKRSGFVVMAKLIGLVKPLTGYMLLAIFMGLIGHLCATFISGCINLVTIILRYEADMQSVFLSYTKKDLNSSYTCFLRISAPKKYSIS